MHFRNRTRVLPPRVFDPPPLPRERFGKLDRRYSIESSGYRRLITEKRSARFTILPIPDIAIVEEEGTVVRKRLTTPGNGIYLFVLFIFINKNRKNRES